MCMKFTKEAIQGPLGDIGRHGDLITQNLIRKKMCNNLVGSLG